MKFSIIMPNYNKANYIEESLLSIYNQTLNKSEYEVIFIDDSSTDNSLEIVNKFLDNKNLIVLHTNQKGAGGARNKGIDKANGEYIIFLDSDDYFANNTVLEQLYSQINDEDIIFLNFIKNNFGEISTIIDEKTDIYEKIAHTKWLGCPTKCFKRSLIGETRFVENRRYEDVSFTLTNLCKAKNYIYLDEPFFVYRKVQNSNTTSEISGIAMTDILLEISSLYYLCFTYPEYKDALITRIKHDRLHTRLDVLNTLIDTGKNTFNEYF